MPLLIQVCVYYKIVSLSSIAYIVRRKLFKDTGEGCCSIQTMILKVLLKGDWLAPSGQ